MIRLITIFAALLLSPVAVSAQTAATPEAAQASEDASAQPQAEPDPSAVEGKLTALEEKVAASAAAVDALKKLKFSGYMQARYAWLENDDYEAGPPSNDNFFIRRGRFKATYDAGYAQYVLQLDATPSGVGVKEAFASIKLPWQGLAVDAGLQLMPFGYEVGVRSSSDLDLLERSRASRSFLAGEYDLGVSVKGVYGPVNFRAGVFNGNGVDGGAGRDNDQLKDFIGRVGFDLGMVTGGVSGWYGETIDYDADGNPRFDRWRTGADLQVFLDLLPVGGTTVKGEVIWGRTFIGRDNGGAGTALGQLGLGYNGIVTQTLGKWNQVSVRYDVWTPDVQIDEAANPTRVFRQDELAVALHHLVGSNLKITAAWFHPMNGDRGPDAPDDPESDSFVAQLQAKF
jgi:hypothetical protein